jgi:fumarate hydratase class II
MSKEYRIEKDSMGELKVPKEALWQAQTQRAVENFGISDKTMPNAFIQALARVKQAAARANVRLGVLAENKAEAIIEVAQTIIDDKHLQHFPVDVYQTGSGTSSNMNMNEVLSTLASTETLTIHPNDDVNAGQSSNDVIPTALQASACLLVSEALLPNLTYLQETMISKAEEVEGIVKTGRTHLMDAMPVTMAQELMTWATQIDLAKARLNHSLTRLSALPLGGTAVGTGVNSHPDFPAAFCSEISRLSGFSFHPASNLFIGISTQDNSVELSGQLKTLATALMKISNDLRWMNSGPLSGLAEISLPALQPGSSIMPGKVNPVIPEAVCMASARVIGLDTAITVGGQSGNFQLNVMLPMIADSLLEGISLMANSALLLADKAIKEFKVNEENITKNLSANPILVTSLNSVIGYEKGAAIAKEAYANKRPVIEVAMEYTDLSREELEELLNPSKLTQP